MLLNKLTSPGDRPLIKPINANREDVLSMVDGNRGITLTCKSSTGNILPGVVYREVRDGNGPTRVGYVAYWRRNNDNPALKQFLRSLASPSGGAAGRQRVAGLTVETAVLLYFFAPLRRPL